MPSLDGVFFTVGIGLASALGAFGISLGIARKRSPNAFTASLPQGHESPTRLAMRALGWGTICAVVGVGSIVMAAKYMTGVSNVRYSVSTDYVTFIISMSLSASYDFHHSC